MRCMVKIEIPVELGNTRIAGGTMADTFGTILGLLRPDSAYFYPEHGKRAALFMVDISDAAQMAQVAEGFFLGLNADVSITPVMTVEDLQRGLTAVEQVKAALDAKVPALAG